MEALVDCGRL